MRIHSYDHYGQPRVIDQPPGTIIQELTRARIVSISTGNTGGLRGFKIRDEKSATNEAHLTCAESWRLIWELIRVLVTGWHPYRHGVYEHSYWTDEKHSSLTPIHVVDAGTVTLRR